MKVTLNHIFETASGKVCGKSSTYVCYNKQTGKMYTGEFHGSNQPNSEDQQAVKTDFKQRAQLASAWWNANKPLKDKDGTVTREATESYTKVITAYKAQKKLGNPYSYLRTLVTDDLKVILAGKDITGGITIEGTTQTSGGNGGSTNNPPVLGDG